MNTESDTLTVYELPRSMIAVTKDLFAEMWFDEAFTGAVFEGRQDARVFVDDPTRPTAAIMSHIFGYYVAGTPDAAALRTFIREMPAEAGIFPDLFGYVPVNGPWALALLDDYGDKLVVVARRGFRWLDSTANQKTLQQRRLPPAGVTVCAIDDALALRLENEIREYVGHIWGGRDAFVSKAFGYCTLVDDKPASIAYAVGIGSGEANIGVFTMPEFRRQGHAVRACTAYIDHCLRLGLVPTWDCDSDNPRSADLARKLGFRELPPFTQLSPPRGTTIPESHGLWSSSPAAGGVTRWQRVSSS